MEALKEQEPINRIASRYEVLPTQVSAWKSQLLKRLPETFESDNKRSRTETDWEEHEARLFQKIGQLEVELDWLKKIGIIRFWTKKGVDFSSGKVQHDARDEHHTTI